MSQPLPPPQIPGLEFLGKLGSGGYADVYLYEEGMPARKVAVKVMREVGLSAGQAARFTAEANAMARLEHPHIVPVYSAGTTADGRPYIVMMYYPQANLAERVKRERFSVAEVLRIGIQISSAVETLGPADRGGRGCRRPPDRERHHHRPGEPLRHAWRVDRRPGAHVRAPLGRQVLAGRPHTRPERRGRQPESRCRAGRCSLRSP